MINAEKLLHCFPDAIEHMIVSESDEHLLIINAVEDYDPDASRISLDIKTDVVTLRFISISHGYQGEGYCKKILATLFDMCYGLGLSLDVDKACTPVEHIFDNLVQGCSHVEAYIKILPAKNEWLGPNLEIRFSKHIFIQQ